MNQTAEIEMASAYHHDSETFVRIGLTGIDFEIPCFGRGSKKPSVEFLTSKWTVYLKNHIPPPVFEAMMHDIYNGPKFGRYLSAYSVVGLLGCMCCSKASLENERTGMRDEVSRKLVAWNKVLTEHNCGVTMQIETHWLVFNILPGELLFKNDDSSKHREALTQQLLLDLGLKH